MDLSATGDLGRRCESSSQAGFSI